MPHQKEAVAGGICQAPWAGGASSDSAAAPNAMTPACTAVSVSAGIAWRPARRRVMQTITARRKAASTINPSPQPTDIPASEVTDSIAAPSAESPAAQKTRRAGRWPSSHHSTKGVNATHKLMRKAALLAVVSDTPKVSHTKMASRFAPSTPPTARPWRHAAVKSGRSAGSRTRKVSPKRSAMNSSTGNCCVACLATA
jgi:hypothetical protein